MSRPADDTGDVAVDLDAIRARHDVIHTVLDSLGQRCSIEQYKGLVRTVAKSADDVPILDAALVEARAEADKLRAEVETLRIMREEAWDEVLKSRAALEALSRPYAVLPHGSCHVSSALGSQWRNGPHWHVVWPDGDSWCYETEYDARDRVVELRTILAADPVSLADVRCTCDPGPEGQHQLDRCAKAVNPHG